MKIPPNGLYNSKKEAKETMKKFFEEHPKSKKRYAIYLKSIWILKEVK